MLKIVWILVAIIIEFQTKLYDLMFVAVVDYLLGQVISMDNFTQATFDYWRDALADPQVYADNAKVVSALVDAFYGDKQQPNLATSHTTWFERYVEVSCDTIAKEGEGLETARSSRFPRNDRLYCTTMNPLCKIFIELIFA